MKFLILSNTIFLLIVVGQTDPMDIAYDDWVPPKRPAACPPDFILAEKYCYYFDTNPTTWPEAVKSCQKRRAVLAMPTSSPMNKYLTDHIRQNYKGINFWIGGQDEINEGKWQWYTDNSPMSYTDWNPGEPNNDFYAGNVEDCLILFADYDYHWNDYPCEQKHGFVCQTHI